MEEIISFVGVLCNLVLINEIYNGMKSTSYRGFTIEKAYNHYYIVGITGEFSSKRAAKHQIDNYLENYSNET